MLSYSIWISQSTSTSKAPAGEKSVVKFSLRIKPRGGPPGIKATISYINRWLLLEILNPSTFSPRSFAEASRGGCMLATFLKIFIEIQRDKDRQRDTAKEYSVKKIWKFYWVVGWFPHRAKQSVATLVTSFLLFPLAWWMEKTKPWVLSIRIIKWAFVCL